MRKHRTFICVIIVNAVFFQICTALELFQAKIPNGYIVPHPCRPAGWTWPAVGHATGQGGGARNLFGIDFQKAGYKVILLFLAKILLTNDSPCSVDTMVMS